MSQAYVAALGLCKRVISPCTLDDLFPLRLGQSTLAMIKFPALHDYKNPQ